MRRLASHVRSERGFSLSEVLVVILIIGVLAAIGLAAFLNQRHKGADASAKSAARNLASAVEACHAVSTDYRDCDQETDLDDEAAGLGWGTSPGEVSVTGATANSYTIEAVSKGNTGGSAHRFTLTRQSNGKVDRTCVGTGGCEAGTW
jgi:type IV pilus assembly protein PilA